MVYVSLANLFEVQMVLVLGVGVANVDLAGRILFNVLYCAKVNRDKKNGKYDKYAGYNDDRNPDFKMIL